MVFPAYYGVLSQGAGVVPFPTSGIQLFYYPNNSGNTIIDESPNTNDGTAFNGVVISSSTSDNYMQFDGSDDYARTVANFATPTTEYSISLWVNPTTIQANDRTILSKYYDGSTRDFELYTNNQNLQFLSSFNNVHRLMNVNGTWSAGNWYHVVVTIKSGEQKMYLNNSLVDSDTITGTINNINVPLYVGARGYGGPTQYFPGKVAGLVVYNKVLNTTEIGQIYSAGRTHNPF